MKRKRTRGAHGTAGTPCTRATNIRNLTNRGVPLQRIMQMTGHKNLPTHMGYNVVDEKDLDLIREKYESTQPRREPRRARQS